MKKETLKILPENPNTSTVYVLKPNGFNQAYYDERTDRNIGWIKPEEQKMLHQCTVGIAGCGGMGGLIAATMIRLGVGHVKIADCEDFDVSNLNRQFAATKETVGKSKAFSTASKLRKIADDTQITVYPQGIDKETAEDFVRNCDVICDEIEFWAVGSRILLHQYGRNTNAPMLICCTVGHRTYMMCFTKESMTMEDALGFGLDQAMQMQNKIQQGSAEKEEIQCVMDAMLKVIVPEIPEYSVDPSFSTEKEGRRRLLEQIQAPIIASNPPMASGFISNHVLFQLLKKSPVKRIEPKIVPMPGYVAFDAYMHQTLTATEKWWK